jgi:signal transduction histidine kinase
VAGTNGSDTAGIWLATTPANAFHRRLTLAVMAALFSAFLVAASFANVSFPSSNGFIPYIQGTMFVAELITAALLFTKFSILRSNALFILANGYLFCALIIIAHTLTFPGAFAPGGLLGASFQTAGWLHVVWHLVFPVSVIAYTWMRNREDTNDATVALGRAPKAAIFSSIAVVIVSVITLTCGIIAADKFLPSLFLDNRAFTSLAVYTGWFTAVTCVVAFLWLWKGDQSVLDRWVMVAIFATLLEMIMLSFIGERFTIGWYCVRFFGVTTSTIVLIALLTETSQLYARLAIALGTLQRDRDNKLINAQAIVAAIAHEVRQPLTGITAGGGAARRFLERNPPDVARARVSIETVVNAAHHVSQVFEGIRALFGKGGEGQGSVDLNQIVLDVMQSMRVEFRTQLVAIQTELTAKLPLVTGHEGQLREVVTNLFQNAFEAMRETTDRNRLLKVSTALRNRSEVVLTVEETGPGIEPERLAGIFGAFVTTKAQGTGLGLAICRMIIEHHGGQLTASSDGVSGALFQFVLPFEPTKKALPSAA